MMKCRYAGLFLCVIVAVFMKTKAYHRSLRNSCTVTHFWHLNSKTEKQLGKEGLEIVGVGIGVRVGVVAGFALGVGAANR